MWISNPGRPGRNIHQGRNLLVQSLILIVALLAPPSGWADDVIELEELAIRSAVERAAPSVVRIETFGGLERVGRLLVSTGPTTGLIVSADGYVLASAFNFVQQPSSILVVLPGGSRAAAEIVARDHARMLVLLKITTDEKLQEPDYASRDEMAVGQWSIALGRTFPGESPSLSVGIVSALNRIWGKAIQTDAKISPNNYGGPLIDIQGRVLGVLVPLSPQSQHQVAGAEWYDSGIGFAIPLADVMARLNVMKQGQDLRPGIMGISLKGNDLYGQPAEIAACQPNSPAAEAGLRKGDIIIRANGQSIERQAQLKHALGPLYAGDEVLVVVARQDEHVDAVIKLTDKLIPYEHPFLGVLPLRDADDAAGIVVRFVYAGSPAEAAGIQVADRLLSMNGQPVQSAHAFSESLATLDDRQNLNVDVQRGDERLTLSINLGILPTEIPADLPAAWRDPAAHNPEQDLPPLGVVDIKLNEQPNECLAYVPDNYHPDVPHGLVIWLDEPGGFNKEALVACWKDRCAQNHLILLAPQAQDAAKWQRTELEFIHKAAADLISHYEIDPSRVVAHGYRAGGSLCYILAFAHRELIRGVAAVDAAIPFLARPPANDPLYRLSFYTTVAADAEFGTRIQASIDRLLELKYPVTVHDQGAEASYLDDPAIDQLVRWIDTLDRI